MSDDTIYSTKLGTHSIIKNGEVIKDVSSKLVYCNSQNDLEAHTSEFPAGTIAATYGFGDMWQLDDSGVWRDI